MQASNQPDVSDLPSMSLSDLLDWRDALAGVLDELVNQNPKVREARDLLTKTNAVIHEKVRPEAEELYEVRGKTHGRMKFGMEGTVVTSDIPQTVKWDQEKLREIASRMSWEDVQKTFKIEFTVPEAVYKSPMMSDDLKDKLTAARTTKTGDIKINVERA